MTLPLFPDHMEKDFSPIPFSVMLGRAPYAFQRRIHYKYQHTVAISHLRDLRQSPCHYIMFIRVFGPRFLYEDTNVEIVEESAASQENFPQAEDSTQMASIRLHLADN
jgi:hypothetical protein